MENETAREIKTARGDKVRIMCGEGERERPAASWKTKWRGKSKWREGEVMCSEGERGRCRWRQGKQNGEMDGNEMAARG
ncbi:hypothetical protein ACOSQ4_012947 [Xanthoceras sorbifolium]